MIWLTWQQTNFQAYFIHTWIFQFRACRQFYFVPYFPSFCIENCTETMPTSKKGKKLLEIWLKITHLLSWEPYLNYSTLRINKNRDLPLAYHRPYLRVWINCWKICFPGLFYPNMDFLFSLNFCFSPTCTVIQTML